MNLRYILRKYHFLNFSFLMLWYFLSSPLHEPSRGRKWWWSLSLSLPLSHTLSLFLTFSISKFLPPSRCSSLFFTHTYTHNMSTSFSFTSLSLFRFLLSDTHTQTPVLYTNINTLSLPLSLSVSFFLSHTHTEKPLSYTRTNTHSLSLYTYTDLSMSTTHKHILTLAPFISLSYFYTITALWFLTWGNKVQTHDKMFPTWNKFDRKT